MFKKLSLCIISILILFTAVPVSAHNMPMGGSKWCIGKNSITAAIELNSLLFADIKGIKEGRYNPETCSDEQLRQIATAVLQPYINDKLSIAVNGKPYPVKVTKLGRNENNQFTIWLAVENVGFTSSANPVRIAYRLLFEETDNSHLNLAFLYLTDAVGERLQKVLDFSQPDGQYTFDLNAAVWELSIAGPAAGLESNGIEGTDNLTAAVNNGTGLSATDRKKGSSAPPAAITLNTASPRKPTAAASGRVSAGRIPDNNGAVSLTVRGEGNGVVENKPAKKAMWANIGQFILLGIEHILTGYDHIAFLLALIVIGLSIKEVLKIITAFTVAHSITLLLAAMQVVSLNSRIVESVIAFSICYVALENLLRKKVNYRWLLTFGFGLIHGFGFASVLQELIVGKSNLLVSVVSFNLGVEVGQLMIFLVLLPILHVLKNKIEFRKVTMGTSFAIFLLGFTWLIQRGFNLTLLPF